MGKRLAVMVVATALALATLGASAASASGTDVVRRGACSANSHWKLDLSKSDTKIEVDFEVHQGTSGDTWNVVMRHNGNVFFRGKRTTAGSEGTFDVVKRVNNAGGTDRFVAKATNASSGEVCKGAAKF